jgi:excisionase family DNA binding protein
VTERRTYTVPEVADLLGLSAWSVFAHVKDGTFPVAPIRCGRRILFSKALVDALLNGDVA